MRTVAEKIRRKRRVAYWSQEARAMAVDRLGRKPQRKTKTTAMMRNSAFIQSNRPRTRIGCRNNAFMPQVEIVTRTIQLRNLWRARGCIASKSIMVRKSMVLKWESSAGGPQIFAPSVRYARSNLGI